MWVIALIGAATGFIESTLAQIYKEPVAKGGFYGGPAYYIRYGLNNKALSVLFAILISIIHTVGFTTLYKLIHWLHLFKYSTLMYPIPVPL